MHGGEFPAGFVGALFSQAEGGANGTAGGTTTVREVAKRNMQSIDPESI